jgi:hypothetical protein
LDAGTAEHGCVLFAVGENLPNHDARVVQRLTEARWRADRMRGVAIPEESELNPVDDVRSRNPAFRIDAGDEGVVAEMDRATDNTIPSSPP